MAMIKADLTKSLKSFLRDAKSSDEAAEGLADIIDSYIRTATVTVSPQIPVLVAVPAGTGFTTAPGTGSLS